MSSRLDYCNSLLSGIAETDLTEFQRILTIWLVWSQSHHRLLAVSLLRSLHWLPVKYRVHFKICLLTYKALHDEQPVYLRSLIATSLPSHSLRSSISIILSVPRIKTNTGARAFSSCALLFGTTFHYLCVQPPWLPPSEDVSKHTFSTWPPPRRHRCALLPVDVAE